MLVMLERHCLSTEEIGTEAGDICMADWYTMRMLFSMGFTRVYLGTIFGFRSLERSGIFPEVAAKLRPDYKENMDNLIKRMTAPHGGAINDASDAEWRWLEQCRK
jgi:hypothetical protein